MAIDPKELEAVRPTSSAVDRLKARKNRIKPWQSAAIADSASVADSQVAPTQEAQPPLANTSDLGAEAILKASAASPLDADQTPIADMPISNLGDPGASTNNTDKVPTTVSAGSSKAIERVPTKSRQSTDKEIANDLSAFTSAAETASSANVRPQASNTGKIPTTTKSDGLTSVTSEFNTDANADKIPTTDMAGSQSAKPADVSTRSSVRRQSTDKIPTSTNEPVPTVVITSTDNEPTKYRQRTSRANKGDLQDSSTGKIPTRSRQSTDKIPTIVPTTDFAFVGSNTDNEIQLSPQVLEQRYKSLSGGQLALMMYCYNECVSRGTNSFATTYPDLAKAASINESSVRTTAKIVKSRGLLEITFKKGPGGRIELLIPEMVFRIVTRNQATHAWSTDKIPATNEAEYRQNTDHSADKIASSKLVSDLSSNLLTNEPTYEGFESIDLAVVQKFGISRKHIQDIRNQKLSVSLFQIEDFISRFALYASQPENVRSVKNIPALFIRMVQLLAQGQDPLLDIETPEEKLLKQLLERQKRQREEKLKLEQELADGEFETWFARLSTTDRDNIAPPTIASASGSLQQRMLLKKHFASEVWPQLLAELKQNSQ